MTDWRTGGSGHGGEGPLSHSRDDDERDQATDHTDDPAVPFWRPTRWPGGNSGDWSAWEATTPDSRGRTLPADDRVDMAGRNADPDDPDFFPGDDELFPDRVPFSPAPPQAAERLLPRDDRVRPEPPGHPDAGDNGMAQAGALDTPAGPLPRRVPGHATATPSDAPGPDSIAPEPAGRHHTPAAAAPADGSRRPQRGLTGRLLPEERRLLPEERRLLPEERRLLPEEDGGPGAHDAVLRPGPPPPGGTHPGASVAANRVYVTSSGFPPDEERLPSERDGVTLGGNPAAGDRIAAEDLPGSEHDLAPWSDDDPADDHPSPPIGPTRRPWARHRGTRVKARPIQRVTAYLSIAAMTVVVVTLLAAYWQVRGLWENIHRVPVSGLLGRRPPRLSAATNILMFSASTGAGLTAPKVATLHLTRGTQARADTIMVVHIPPGGLDPTVISFPHALQVPRYGCKSAGPGQPRQAPDMSVRQPLNTSFGFGPACLWRTVEQVSGIRLDHFIELGLGGFVRAVNAVGGVTLFSPTAVNDPDTGLHLQPGYNHLGGVQALAFWRTGDGVGVSSDLLRIHRDQNLMVAFMRSVSQSDLAAHPASLLTVLSDLTSSMTVDSGLSEAEMLRIALDLKNAESQQVRFITVPNIPDPGNVGVDSLAQPAAGQLFSEIAHDRPPG